MAIKHALIVDDSKAARTVLERMLVELSLEVEAVPSALEALEYLESHQPDVIFMDHMMPGMDGFEALKHIKTNPATSVIPIMMYTSKGGDVYLSQARSLGAVGVIPKTISPVGLKESLFKLGLVDDRRVSSEPKQTNRQPNNEDRSVLNKNTELQKDDCTRLLDEFRKLMDEQTVELHKSMWLGVESASYEIYNRLTNERKKLQEEEARKKIIDIQDKSVPENTGSHLTGPLVIVSIMFILSLVFNFRLFSNYSEVENKLDTLTSKLQLMPELVDKMENAQRNSYSSDGFESDNIASLMDFVSSVKGMVVDYPYNELALNDRRVPYIEEIVNKALASNYRGKILLQTHVGQFCMKRDADGNYTLAQNDQNVAECEFTGNYIQPADAPSTHQSLSFANYLSEINTRYRNRFEIDVVTIPRDVVLAEYPQDKVQTSVKEWNSAAQTNNRITVKLEPAMVATGDDI